MKEFGAYDAMIADYNESRSLVVLPLSSWEFYGEHIAFLSDCKEDIAALKKITRKWDFDEDYKKELIMEKSVLVITNMDLKIVYASRNIEEMSGYSSDEVIGNSPKMFQGVNTSTESSSIIRNAVHKKMPFEVSILNYRKDNSTYICNIKGFPVKDRKGKVVNYIAFEQIAA